jgi:hypothetical protein
MGGFGGDAIEGSGEDIDTDDRIGDDTGGPVRIGGPPGGMGYGMEWCLASFM